MVALLKVKCEINLAHFNPIAWIHWATSTKQKSHFTLKSCAKVKQRYHSYSCGTYRVAVLFLQGWPSLLPNEDEEWFCTSYNYGSLSRVRPPFEEQAIVYLLANLCQPTRSPITWRKWSFFGYRLYSVLLSIFNQWFRLPSPNTQTRPINSQSHVGKKLRCILRHEGRNQLSRDY